MPLWVLVTVLLLVWDAWLALVMTKGWKMKKQILLLRRRSTQARGEKTAAVAMAIGGKPRTKSDSIHTQSNEPVMPPPCAWIALEGKGRESQECLSDRGWYKTVSAPLKQAGLALAQCEKARALKCALLWALFTLTLLTHTQKKG